MFKKFKNRIITIEGADGTGKDTVTDLLHEKIPNSYVVRFPDRTNKTGNVLNKILKKELPFPDPLLFQSLMLANKIETLHNIDLNPNIRPEWFIFCRYVPSGLIYGNYDGLPIGLTVEINSVLPESSRTFVLTGKNYGHNTEHYEQTEIQRWISEEYIRLAELFNWELVSNLETPEEIADIIKRKMI